MRIVIFLLFSIMYISANAQNLVPRYDSSKHLWGYTSVSDRSRYVIKPKFEDAKAYGDGFAPVKIKGRYGYLDEKGKVVIKAQYTNAEPFSNGLGIVKDENLYGAINTSGNIIIPLKYLSITKEPQLQLFIAQSKLGYQLYNKEGALLFDDMFTSVPSFNEDRLAIVDNGKGLGAITPAGLVAIPLKFKTLNNVGSKYVAQNNNSEAFSVFEKKGLSNIFDEVKYDASLYNIDSLIFVRKMDGAICGLNKNYEEVFSDVVILGDYILVNHNQLLDICNQKSIYSGEIHSINDYIIRIFDVSKNFILSYDLQNKRIGVYQNQVDQFYGTIDDEYSSLCDSNEEPLLIFHHNNDITILNKNGEKIWPGYEPAYPFNDEQNPSLYVIRNSNNKNYYVASTDGNIYPYVFSYIGQNNDCKYYSGTTEIEGILCFDKGNFVIKGNEYNYNSYTWYYDVSNKMYGKINEDGEIISAANSKTKILPPLGKKFLSTVNIWYKMPHQPFRGWMLQSKSSSEYDAIFIFEYTPINRITEREMTFYMFLKGNRLYNVPDNAYMGTVTMDAKGNLTITNGSGVGSGNYNFGGKYVLSEFL